MDEKLQIYESKILDAQKNLEKIITKYSDFESENAKKIIHIQKELYKHMDNLKILQDECEQLNNKNEFNKYQKSNWQKFKSIFKFDIEIQYKLSEIKPLIEKK